jgi:cytochrome b561
VRLLDTTNGYGWISILLHWLAALVVMTMWVIGSMSQAADDSAYPDLVRLHTSLGLTAYVLLLGRIVWRLWRGHPGPLPRQGRIFFGIGKYFHYLLLLALAAMLVSGPLMVWTGGDAIGFYRFDLPGPFPVWQAAHDRLRALHGAVASFIFLGTLLHVAAAIKHAAFNRDGTFDKIMIPASESRK